MILKECALDSRSPGHGWLTSISRVPGGGIATALLLRVLLFSTVVTLILTILQLSLSYRGERTRLESRFGEIDQATSRSLSESLWAMDSKQLQEQLEGILRLPSIRAVQVREAASSAHAFTVFRGERQTANAVVKEFPLSCCGERPQVIGVLHIEATLTDIYRDVAVQAVVILLSNAAKTFLVALFILFVVHRLATRHLQDIAASMGSVDPDVEAAPLRLRRVPGKGDELDQLVDAFNAMRERLRQDITDLRRAEHDLRASEARFRTFVDRATDAFFLLDDQLTVIDVNRQACEGLGYARDVLIGMHPRDFDATLDEQSIVRLAERAGAGETITFETQHRRRDGTVLPVEIRTGMFRQGDRMFYLALARDITERKLAQERLREQDHALQTARAELAHVSRLTTLGELSSSIVHEVSQPLGGMITGAGACARWLGAEPPDIAAARAALDNIAADGKRAREVIARIRALSKRQLVCKERLDINQKLVEVLALTEHEARSHRIVRRTELDRTLPRVLGDRVQLQQVLLNLIVNAIEAMDAVGDRPRLLTIVSRHESPDAVLVEVRDTGTGLDPQHIEQVFEAFYTTKTDGIGIGLSISRSIVEAHGGRLWASPNEPHGAVFRLTLPVAAAEELP